MLDTIITRDGYKRLQKLNIKIYTNNLCSDLWSGTANKRYIDLKKIPTRVIKKVGYLPGVSLGVNPTNPSGRVSYLKLQFSAPQIIRGCSYWMTDQYDANILYSELSKKLKMLGIEIEPEQIKQLSIMSFAFCWNAILAARLGNPLEWLRNLCFLTEGARYTNTRHTNYDEGINGFCLREYSQNHGSKIYLKALELINNPKKTPQEIEIAELIKGGILTDRLFRLEHQFQKRPVCLQAFKRYLRDAKKNDSVELVKIQDLFNDDFCQFHLMEMVNRIGKIFNTIALDMGNIPFGLPNSELLKIANEFNVSGTQKIILAFYASCVGQGGVRNANTIINNILNKRDRDLIAEHKRLIGKKLEKLKPFGFNTYELFEEIKTQINGREMYKNRQELNNLVSIVEARNKIRKKPCKASLVLKNVKESYQPELFEGY